MNKINSEDVIIGARFKANIKPIPIEENDDGDILYAQPDIVRVVNMYDDGYVVYVNESTDEVDGKPINNFIYSFRDIKRVTWCWFCYKTLDQYNMKLKECDACGGVECPDDDHCLCTHPTHGKSYRENKPFEF